MSHDTEKLAKGYSAFISHASLDREAAEAVAASLEAKGLTCWIAPRDVRPGMEYAEEILRGIEASKCFVLLLSGAANLSAHVRREVERAASKGKPIYPVRIENVPPSPKLEYFVSMLHWLDAWDGLLEDHAARLAAALDSKEEWIGNRVLKRRHRRVIGMSAGLAATVLAIAVAMVFSEDIRDLFDDDQTRAAERLVERDPIDVEELARALVAASVLDLELFDAAGITSRQLNVAFATSAGSFFEQSRGEPRAITWLEQALKNGLDPNLPLPHEHYGRESMLAAALRSGNAEAMLALLEAGASPHVFQDLMLSPYAVPRFLFPYYYLLTSDVLTAEQKTRLAGAYAEAGAIHMPLSSENARGGSTYQHDAVETAAERADLFGLTLEPAPSVCESPRAPAMICEAASERTGRDWCGFMQELPVRVMWNADKSYDVNLLRLDLQRLLAVVDNKAYVLGTETIGREREYLLVEVSADGRSWEIYKHMPPAAGKGLCKTFVDDGPDAPTPEYCWRRWSATYQPADAIVEIEGYYEYDAYPDCSVDRP